MSQRTEAAGGTRGFTLIELLLVVGLIAILALIAIPQYLKYIDNARLTVGIATLDSIRPNMEAYLNEKGQYPVSINFANFTDQDGNRVVISTDASLVTSKLFSWNSYVVSGLSYTITAQALDSKHTVLNLTPHGITR
jgi:prepilin-type N-terminal cleavage/methylation domain-containing protein